MTDEERGPRSGVEFNFMRQRRPHDKPQKAFSIIIPDTEPIWPSPEQFATLVQRSKLDAVMWYRALYVYLYHKDLILDENGNANYNRFKAMITGISWPTAHDMYEKIERLLQEAKTPRG